MHVTQDQHKQLRHGRLVAFDGETYRALVMSKGEVSTQGTYFGELWIIYGVACALRTREEFVPERFSSVWSFHTVVLEYSSLIASMVNLLAIAIASIASSSFATAASTSSFDKRQANSGIGNSAFLRRGYHSSAVLNGWWVV
jgi:hypothetical protein